MAPNSSPDSPDVSPSSRAPSAAEETPASPAETLTVPPPALSDSGASLPRERPLPHLWVWALAAAIAILITALLIVRKFDEASPTSRPVPVSERQRHLT